MMQRAYKSVILRWLLISLVIILVFPGLFDKAGAFFTRILSAKGNEKELVVFGNTQFPASVVSRMYAPSVIYDADYYEITAKLSFIHKTLARQQASLFTVSTPSRSWYFRKALPDTLQARAYCLLPPPILGERMTRLELPWIDLNTGMEMSESPAFEKSRDGMSPEGMRLSVDGIIRGAISALPQEQMKLPVMVVVLGKLADTGLLTALSRSVPQHQIDFFVHNPSISHELLSLLPESPDSLRRLISSSAALILLLGAEAWEIPLQQFARDAYKAFYPADPAERKDLMEDMIRSDPSWLKEAVARSRSLSLSLDSTISYIALETVQQRRLPPPGEDTIAKLIALISSDAPWLESEKEKARKSQEPLEKVLRRDAVLLYRCQSFSAMRRYHL